MVVIYLSCWLNLFFACVELELERLQNNQIVFKTGEHFYLFYHIWYTSSTSLVLRSIYFLQSYSCTLEQSTLNCTCFCCLSDLVLGFTQTKFNIGWISFYDTHKFLFYSILFYSNLFYSIHTLFFSAICRCKQQLLLSELFYA